MGDPGSDTDLWELIFVGHMPCGRHFRHSVNLQKHCLGGLGVIRPTNQPHMLDTVAFFFAKNLFKQISMTKVSS